MDKYSTEEHENYKDELGDDDTFQFMPPLSQPGEAATYPVLLSKSNLEDYLSEHEEEMYTYIPKPTSAIRAINIIGENTIYHIQPKERMTKKETRVAASILGGVFLTALAGFGIKMMGKS